MKIETAKVEIVAPRAALGFLDQRSMACGSPPDPLAAWHRMSQGAGAAERLALRLRDALSGGGAGQRRVLPEAAPGFVQPGDSVGFFTVERLTDERLTLAARQDAVQTMICLTIHDRSLMMTTSIRARSRLRLLALRPLHRFILARMCRRLI